MLSMIYGIWLYSLQSRMGNVDIKFIAQKIRKFNIHKRWESWMSLKIPDKYK